jgi:hypothetical protein
MKRDIDKVFIKYTNFSECDALLEAKTISNSEYFSILSLVIERYLTSCLGRLLLDKRAKEYIPEEDLLVKNFDPYSISHPGYDSILSVLTLNPPFDIDPLINTSIKTLISYLTDTSIDRKFYNSIIAEKLEGFSLYVKDDKLASEMFRLFIREKKGRGINRLVNNKNVEFDDDIYKTAVGKISDGNWGGGQDIVLVDILISKDSRFDVTGNNNSALDIALLRGGSEMIKKLIKRGADFGPKGPEIFRNLILENYGDPQYEIIKNLDAMLTSDKIKKNKELIRQSIQDAQNKKLTKVVTFLKRQL